MSDSSPFGLIKQFKWIAWHYRHGGWEAIGSSDNRADALEATRDYRASHVAVMRAGERPDWRPGDDQR